MRKIGMVLVLAGVIIAGSMGWSSLTHADQPLDCAPENRVVPGNTNTDCKWDFSMDEVTGVRFVVSEREGADACYGALEFYPYDFDDLGRGGGLILAVSRTPTITGQPVVTQYFSYDYTVEAPHEPGNSGLRVFGDLFYLDTPIPNRWRTGFYDSVSFPSTTFHNLGLYVEGKSNAVYPGDGVNYASRWFSVPPEVNDFPVMLNACLAGVKLRLETEAQMERDRTRLAAQELAKQQALNEEKAKAALDAQRLASAQKALQIQRETELTKTRSLIARLERDKVILGVWNDIVLERLRGFQERAEITNRYLAEIEANAAAFSAKVREKYEELQRLEALNQAIADSIAAHNQEIEAQLAAAAELEARNMAKLEDLAVTAPTPAPTPGG